jgi:hypothetical protein
MVNIVGRRLPNFTEYERTGEVSLSDLNISAVIYFRKTHDLYTRANAPGDESYLVHRNLADGTETIIFEGNLGHDIMYAFVDEGNQRLLYTFRNIRGGESRYTYLVVYDLQTHREINRIQMLDADAYDYRNEGHFLGAVAFVSYVMLDEGTGQIIFVVRYKEDSAYFNAEEYFSLDADTGILTAISARAYEEVYTAHFEQRGERSFFAVYPYSDRLYDNYRPRYNGLYVNDGERNIRVSTRPFSATDIAYTTIWLNNGSYVINGSYVYDATGRKHEMMIVNGDVLAVY